MKKFLISTLCLSLILVFPVFSQEANFFHYGRNAVKPGFSLEGRHSLSASLGLVMEKNGAPDATPEAFSANTGVNNFAGMMRYRYWFRRDWALNVGVGLLSSDGNVSYAGQQVTNQNGSVFAVLMGLRYQPESWAISPKMRPYISVEAGPIVGYGTNSDAESATSGSRTFYESAAGTHLGAGMDWFFGQSLYTGLNGGYYLMTDFKKSIAGRKNFSSPDFGVTLGFLFGGRSGK